MTDIHQVKLVFDNNVSYRAAHSLALELTSLDINHFDFYIPRYNTKMIVFKYNSLALKNKLLNYRDLEQLKRRYKFTLHRPIPSDTIDKSSRTIFVWNLNPSFFFCDTTEDGPETLDMKMSQMLQDLKFRLGTKDLNITDHHFIKQDNKPPQSLKLTFESADQASRFNAEDTITRCEMLLARSKKFDQHVSIRQCGVCRKTDHYRGDPNKCDQKQRCPRCLSEDHSSPQVGCIPTCWTHRIGHSTGSEKCPLIRNYKRDKRREDNNIRNREQHIQRTPAEVRPFHRDLLRVEDTVRAAKSYAGVTKRNSTVPSLPTVLKSTLDPAVFLMAHVRATHAEVCKHGLYQKIMDQYCDLNGWSKIKHPPPLPEELRAVASLVTAFGEESTLVADPLNSIGDIYPPTLVPNNSPAVTVADSLSTSHVTPLASTAIMGAQSLPVSLTSSLPLYSPTHSPTPQDSVASTQSRDPRLAAKPKEKVTLSLQNLATATVSERILSHERLNSPATSPT